MPKNQKPHRHSVFLKQQNRHFLIETDQTILQAAMASNIQFPVSCRNGSCRTCMSKILEGKVHYKMEWPSLSKEEKNDSWILPCVAFADSDVVLEITHVEKVHKS